MNTQFELDNFFRKLNELSDKQNRGEIIELDEQIDFLLMAGQTNMDEELKQVSQKVKNRRNNLKELLGDQKNICIFVIIKCVLSLKSCGDDISL